MYTVQYIPPRMGVYTHGQSILLRNIAFHTLTDLRLPMEMWGGRIEEKKNLLDVHIYILRVCLLPFCCIECIPLINSHQRGGFGRRRKKRLSGHFFCAYRPFESSRFWCTYQLPPSILFYFIFQPSMKFFLGERKKKR